MLLPKLPKLLSGLEDGAGAGNNPEDCKLLCVEPLVVCKLDASDPPDGLAWPEKLPPPPSPDAPEVAELNPDTRSPPFWVPSIPEKLDCAPFGPLNVDENDAFDGETVDPDLRANGPSCPEEEKEPPDGLNDEEKDPPELEVGAKTGNVGSVGKEGTEPSMVGPLLELAALATLS